MISKTLENIEKDIKYLKKIANEEHFKKVEELCEEVNARNNKLQDRIDSAINYLEEQKNTNQTIVDKTGWYIRDKVYKILKGEYDNE